MLGEAPGGVLTGTQFDTLEIEHNTTCKVALVYAGNSQHDAPQCLQCLYICEYRHQIAVR